MTGIVGFWVVSCSQNQKSKEDDIKEFALVFAEKAFQNQIVYLKLVYPGIENADSVALKYEAEEIEVNPLENGNEYEVILNPDVKIWIARNEDGSLSVIESTGLFAYPEQLMGIAIQTGLWDENLSEVDQSKRMHVQNFFDYLSSKKVDPDNLISVNREYKRIIMLRSSGFKSHNF